MKASEILNFLVQTGLLGVLLGFVLSGIKYIKALVDAKTAEATARIKDTNVKSAISSTEDCISTVVLEMAQTVVDDLKAKSSDGKLTSDEIKQIQTDTLTKVHSLVSNDAYNTLTTVFGDADQWIKSKVEAAVKNSKTNAAAGK